MADDFNVLDTVSPADPNQLVQQIDGQKTEDGENFFASNIATAIADTASQEWLIAVGTDPVGVKSTFSVEGKSIVEIFEGTLVSANGTAILLFNSNRVNGSPPLAGIFDSPTITNDGTQIAEALLQAGEKQKGITSTESGDRIILKASTNYLIRVTNQSGGTIDIGLTVDFNEPA